ncbi:MAG: discoidin domain-containing protein [Phycisphaerae bacterium]
MTAPRLTLIAALFCTVAAAPVARPQVLDKQKALDAQTFWDNRDFDWYKAHVPFFDCPDPDLVTTWYYRWELVTKHLTYGSPTSGYSFTEFIDRPFWSGAYGAISCPSGHQLYEVRWLADPTYARDYARYWFRTPGAQPRNYSAWLADSLWAVHLVHPDKAFTTDLLADLVKNYDGWAKRQYVDAAGLFWQTGHDDGMEFNINSRQTKDILRGDRGYRPSFNSYMWADAVAIARVADLANDRATADAFRAKAAAIKKELQAKLWDPKRDFFFPMSARDETDKEGNVVKANTLTYQSGKYAGDPHGRELHGYVPWQFNLPDKGFESAWRFLMNPDFFFADRGPTTLERNDPQFVLKKSCCWWSGQSWPFATTQTLKAMANLLHNYEQAHVTRADYAKLLRSYSLSHRKNGKPYLAEALHPDTGSFEGHDGYNHSEHYFHSGFCDLVITGLAGLKTRDDDTLDLDPLAPADWDYFALDDVPYRGHRLSIVWDKTGAKYNRGVGLRVLADGREIAASPTLGKLTVKLPAAPPAPAKPARMNFAVNNDGDYFPRLAASFTAPKTSLAKLIDGNYWYHKDPPNRWTAAGSPSATDWVEIDLGVARKIDTAKLYFLDDGDSIVAPVSYDLQTWNGKAWVPLPAQPRHSERPEGHRPSVVTFPPTEIQQLRFLITHAPTGKTGLTEIELWGDAIKPYAPAPPPAGNLAFNPRKDGFPKATASFSDRFGGTPDKAIDGRIIFLPTPMNRWTSYGSPDPTDWLEIDFGAEKEIGRVVLHVYDDRGGVQPPSKYVVQTWTGVDWRDVAGPTYAPAVPTGSAANIVTFTRAKTSRLRVVFTHRSKARSGLTELEVWRE